MVNFWSGQTYNALKIPFSVTLGEEPEIELVCVLVPIRTENRLRFSARLDDGDPKVRFERAVCG